MGGFKEFLTKSNALALAVGVIIGASLGAVVNSLVNDIIMPPVGLILGGIDFSNIFVTLGKGTYATIAEAQKAGAATLNIGLFINAIIKFLIVAWAVFILVKQVNRFNKKPEAAAAPAVTPPQEVLLAEIRDLLKAKQ